MMEVFMEVQPMMVAKKIDEFQKTNETASTATATATTTANQDAAAS